MTDYWRKYYQKNKFIVFNIYCLWIINYFFTGVSLWEFWMYELIFIMSGDFIVCYERYMSETLSYGALFLEINFGKWVFYESGLVLVRNWDSFVRIWDCIVLSTLFSEATSRMDYWHLWFVTRDVRRGLKMFKWKSFVKSQLEYVAWQEFLMGTVGWEPKQL